MQTMLTAAHDERGAAMPARLDARTGGARLSGASMVFGEVRHRRLRPVGNVFRYRTFFLRLPLSRLADSLAGLRWCAHNRWNLLALHDADHIGDFHAADRADAGDAAGAGAARTPLTWIRALLAREGVTDADGEVWLHTFPRVLGYVFNPVTFWFCERADGAVRAIVCVVSNTFGERHCYLLEHADGRPIVSGEQLCARKVFHVSPFCRIEGGYRFRFMNVRGRSIARIDHDDDRGPLLLTSVGGVHVPLDDAAVRRALLAYPFHTLGVIALIHWQALRLWLKRVPFISKPLPPADQVTR